VVDIGGALKLFDKASQTLFFFEYFATRSGHTWSGCDTGKRDEASWQTRVHL